MIEDCFNETLDWELELDDGEAHRLRTVTPVKSKSEADCILTHLRALITHGSPITGLSPTGEDIGTRQISHLKS